MAAFLFGQRKQLILENLETSSTDKVTYSITPTYVFYFTVTDKYLKRIFYPLDFSVKYGILHTKYIRSDWDLIY